MKLPLAVFASLLMAACGSAPPKSKAKSSEPEKPPPINRLIFGGDVMLSRRVAERIATSNDNALPFRQIAAAFKTADLAFVNLESPFSDQGRPPREGMVFKAPAAAIEGLVEAGIDVVSTANNHTRDQGDYGLRYTLDLLHQHGIAATGTGHTPGLARKGVVLERNGVHFGFLAYTYDQSNGNHKDVDPRVNNLDILQLRQDINSIRQRSHITIVSMHAGTEYAKQPNAQQQQFARAAIEAGATLVIGHHPHVVQPCEEYHTGVICYSLGNLVFDQTIPGTNDGLVVEAEFKGYSLRKLKTRKIRLTDSIPAFTP